MKCKTNNLSVLANNDNLRNNDQDCIVVKRISKVDRFIYTLIHFYIHFAFGLTSSITSPTLVDFSHLLDQPLQNIGFLNTLQGIGTLVGCGITLSFKWLNRQLILTLLTAGMGLSTLFMPYTTQLWQFYLCAIIYGIGIGAWNGSINVVLIEMWKHKSPSMLQLSQFIFGIGSVIGPLLTENYVIGNMICPGILPQECDGYNQTLSDSTSMTTTLEPNSVCTEECLHYDRRPQLKIPFLIGGLLMLIGPICLLIMFFVKRYHYVNEVTVEVTVNEEQKARHKQYVPKNTILIGISIFMAFGIMSENMFTNFCPTFFQYQRTLLLSASKASRIFSTVNASLSVGRFINIFVAMYVIPQHMISFQFFLDIFGWLLLIFGQDQLILLWISADIIGLGYSSIFICMFSFVGQYMEVTDRIGGLFIGSYTVIYLFLPYFISEMIPKYPSIYPLIEISCLSVGIIAFIVVWITVRNVPKDLIRNIRQLN